MIDVVWMPNDLATRQHAVNADTIVPRGAFRIPTICRPHSLTGLLPPELVLGDDLPQCRSCLRKLRTGGVHLTPSTDPPPPGDDVVSPAARAGHLRYDDHGVKVQCYCDEPSTVEAV